MTSKNNETQHIGQPQENSPTITTPINSGLNLKIDLLSGHDARCGGQDVKNSRHFLRKTIITVVILFIVVIVGFGSYAYSITKNQIVDKEQQTGLFGQLRRMIDQDVELLQGEQEDRINILLLGQGGPGHPGGTLTDTIMIVSIKPSTQQAALISLPRDLIVTIDENPADDYFAYRKINYAVEIGGIELAQAKIKEVTGLDIHYYVLADFFGFREMIDDLGGLDINVENSFTDREYPDYNYGYQTITFKAGANHLDGERALQYARSRHGNNGEGSDFARARRQQQILDALRAEALSAGTLLNPTKIGKILNSLGAHLSTNAEIWEMMRFVGFANNINQDTVINKVVDNSENGLLYSKIAEETGAYVLMPKAGITNYSEIQQLAKNIFELSEVLQEQAVIVVQNGSGVNGLAGVTANALRQVDLKIGYVGNALNNDVKKTIIYDLSRGSTSKTLELLQRAVPAKVLAATRPSAANSIVRRGSDLDATVIDMANLPENTSFVVLLGKDAQSQKNNSNNQDGERAKNSTKENSPNQNQSTTPAPPANDAE